MYIQTKLLKESIVCGIFEVAVRTIVSFIAQATVRLLLLISRALRRPSGLFTGIIIRYILVCYINCAIYFVDNISGQPASHHALLLYGFSAVCNHQTFYVRPYLLCARVRAFARDVQTYIPPRLWCTRLKSARLRRSPHQTQLPKSPRCLLSVDAFSLPQTLSKSALT